MIKRIKSEVAVFKEKGDAQKCIMMILVVYKDSTFFVKETDMKEDINWTHSYQRQIVTNQLGIFLC